MTIGTPGLQLDQCYMEIIGASNLVDIDLVLFYSALEISYSNQVHLGDAYVWISSLSVIG